VGINGILDLRRNLWYAQVVKALIGINPVRIKEEKWDEYGRERNN